jgi:hypothetical protein
MRELTYDEWKLNGFHVKKGESSRTRNQNNQATFTRDQVEETPGYDLKLSNDERDLLGIRRR